MLKPCRIDGCTGGKRAHNGLCNKHYLQMKRHGKIFTTRNDLRTIKVDDKYAYIPLGVDAKDGYTVIDKEYAELASGKWRLTHFGYAIRSSDRVLLHRLIANVDRNLVVDHISGDKLDNRLSNIRVCTQAENARNRVASTLNTSGYKGVFLHKPSQRWMAGIKINGKRHHLGYYSNKLEAARVYNEAAIKHHGEYARLNNV